MGDTTLSGGVQKSHYTTKFGSLNSWDKGGVDIINDDPRHYAFSNVYEVASISKPWEKVAVGKNLEYVLEVIRAEGVSQWRIAAHDEFALSLDGEILIELLAIESSPLAENARGSIALEAELEGTKMGTITLQKGHQALIPAGRAYRFSTAGTGVILMQTIEGPDTLYRWSEICQSF